MKTKITQLLAMAILITASAFAGNTNDQVSKTIQTAFAKKFTDAKEVKWVSTESFVKASFQFNGQFIAAFYSNEGEFLGIARNLASNQLPLNLDTELKQNMRSGWLSELFEYGNGQETVYYATIENADQKIILKSINSNSWIVTKKSKK